MNGMMHSECWLGRSLTEFLSTNRYTDCTFIVETSAGNTIYTGHKLIFSCASEVFERMLHGGYQESIDGKVTLTDVEPKVFEKFREFIYSGSNQLNCYELDTIFKLIEFGDKYLVKSFKQSCVRQLLFLKDTCSFQQLLRILECAHTYGFHKLKDRISLNIKFAARHSPTISHVDICALSLDAFKNYLNIVQGIYSEPLRFKLIECYVNKLCVEPDPDSSNENDESEEPHDKPKENLLDELVKLIKFKQFTLQEFYDGPGKSKILSIFDKYNHLGSIATNHAKKLKLTP